MTVDKGNVTFFLPLFLSQNLMAGSYNKQTSKPTSIKNPKTFSDSFV